MYHTSVSPACLFNLHIYMTTWWDSFLTPSSSSSAPYHTTYTKQAESFTTSAPAPGRWCWRRRFCTASLHAAASSCWRGCTKWRWAIKCPGSSRGRHPAVLLLPHPPPLLLPDPPLLLLALLFLPLLLFLLLQLLLLFLLKTSQVMRVVLLPVLAPRARLWSTFEDQFSTLEQRTGLEMQMLYFPTRTVLMLR